MIVMAIPVIMPRQGQSVESCIITKWHKKKGDKVKVGDILFSYETDKSAFDEEAKDEGTILDIFFNEGDDVECLLTVCVIGNEGEDILHSFLKKPEAPNQKSRLRRSRRRPLKRNRSLPQRQTFRPKG